MGPQVNPREGPTLPASPGLCRAGARPCVVEPGRAGSGGGKMCCASLLHSPPGSPGRREAAGSQESRTRRVRQGGRQLPDSDPVSMSLTQGLEGEVCGVPVPGRSSTEGQSVRSLVI